MLQLKLILIQFEVFHGERKTSALNMVHTAGFHIFFTVNLSDIHMTVSHEIQKSSNASRMRIKLNKNPELIN